MFVNVDHTLICVLSCPVLTTVACFGKAINERTSAEHPLLLKHTSFEMRNISLQVHRNVLMICTSAGELDSKRRMEACEKQSFEGRLIRN